MPKIRTNITIEYSVLEGARDKGLNVSNISEEALRQILSTFEQQTLPQDCDHHWTWPFCIPTGLAKECLKCGTFVKVKIESIEETNKRINKINESSLEVIA